jgi:hypothetical protein
VPIRISATLSSEANIIPRIVGTHEDEAGTFVPEVKVITITSGLKLLDTSDVVNNSVEDEAHLPASVQTGQLQPVHR